MSHTQHHIRELREKRCQLAEEANAIVAKAAKEDRGLNGEENANFDKIHADIRDIGERVRVMEKQRDLEAEIAAEDRSAGPRSVSTSGAPKIGATNYSDGGLDRDAIFRRWAVGGSEALTNEERKFLGVSFSDRGTEIPVEIPSAGYDAINRRRPGEREARFQSVGTDSEGGYLVPEDFWQGIVEAQLDFGGVLSSRAFQFNSSDGRPLPIPTVDDTGNTGEQIDENAEVNETTVTFGQANLGAYKYDSKLVRVPHELFEDSAFPVESWLGRMLGTRLARKKNTDLTLGPGTTGPKGVVTAAGTGVTSASSTAITYNELIDLYHSIDVAYRNSGFEWMMHDMISAEIAKLQDGNSRPIWTPNPMPGGFDSLMGAPVVINNDMASAFASGAKVIAAGDFSHFWVREVGQQRMLRLVERFAERDQIGFIIFGRFDSDLVKGESGAGPVKLLVNAA